MFIVEGLSIYFILLASDVVHGLDNAAKFVFLFPAVGTGRVVNDGCSLWNYIRGGLYSYIHTYICTYIHTYIQHTFHGSISVSRGQYDVEQVTNTLQCNMKPTLYKNSILNHLYTKKFRLQIKRSVYVGIFLRLL